MSDQAPRLFLITPRIDEAAAFRPLLEAALETTDVACLLIRAQSRDEGRLKAIVRDLAPLAQKRGVACLVEDEPRLAARAGADGVHMIGPGAGLEEAIGALRPERIVGAGGLGGRDAAMTAGEAGVDYLMFGGPDEPESHEGVRERVEWWAAIFNVPCVAYAREPDRAGDLAEAGAEFIALCDGVWTDEATVRAVLARVARALLPVGEAAR